MRFDFTQLTTYFQRLSARERMMLGIGAPLTALILIYVFVWEPLTESRARVERQIRGRQQDLVEIHELRAEYMDLVNRLDSSRKIIDPENLDDDFSLFPHIESVVSQVLGGREKIRSMNPKTKTINDFYREEAVELKLDGISLDQLTDMMYRIEKGKQPLRVTRLQVKKRRKDAFTFDVTATVSMLKPNEQA